MTAAEFGLTPDQFGKRLERHQAEFRALATLRVAGGTIKRDVFVEQFGRAAFEFGMTTNKGDVPTSVPRSSSSPTVRLDAPKNAGPGEVRRFPDMG